MARIRTVKPEFFQHEGLFDAEQETGLPLRIAFAGLWTQADREGRFQWRPRKLKTNVLPYDEISFIDALEALERHGFVIKYEVEGEPYGHIPSWGEHQAINQREAQSKIPAPGTTHMHARARTVVASEVPTGINIPGPLRETVLDRDKNKCVRCSSKDDLTIDHIFPQCIGGNHAPTNLRTLCRPCNSARPVQGQALIEDLEKDGLTLEDMPRICMHVHAPVEGKGKERKESKKTPPSGGAKKPPPKDGLEIPEFLDKRRGTVLAEDWTLPDEWRKWARDEFGLTAEQIDHEALTMRDWSLSKREAKKDWFAAWRNWVRRDHKPTRAQKSYEEMEAELRSASP